MQITLYHQEACEAVDEDSLLELCDWGYRKLLALNNKQQKQSKPQGTMCHLRGKLGYLGFGLSTPTLVSASFSVLFVSTHYSRCMYVIQ